MATATMAATATAVEDAFLRGDYDAALAQSKAKLAQRVVELNQASSDSDTPQISPDEERVFSIYLQAIFELDQEGEVDTAAAVVDAFSPLPFHVASQWIKFLLAMRRREAAIDVLVNVLDRLRAKLQSPVRDSADDSEYAALMEIHAVEFLFEDAGARVASRRVRDDEFLDAATKSRIVQRIEQLASAMASPSATASPNPSTSYVHGERQEHIGSIHTPSGSTASRSAAAPDDYSYALLGGTAIAVAVAAVGALRYRDRIHEALAGVGPAVSKGLADAKYALFDA